MDKEKSNINIGTILNINNKKTSMTEILKNIGEYLDKMTEEERKEYFKKMGFTIDKEPQKQLKKEYPKK